MDVTLSAFSKVLSYSFEALTQSYIHMRFLNGRCIQFRKHDRALLIIIKSNYFLHCNYPYYTNKEGCSTCWKRSWEPRQKHQKPKLKINQKGCFEMKEQCPSVPRTVHSSSCVCVGCVGNGYVWVCSKQSGCFVIFALQLIWVKVKRKKLLLVCEQVLTWQIPDF